MKGTIKIYAHSVNENQTEFAFDMNVRDVSLHDKFAVIDSLMSALNMGEREKRLYAYGCLLIGGVGKVKDRARFDFDSEDAAESRAKFESLVNEA